MTKISPSILSADHTQIGETLAMLEKAGADMIHCDIMDGVYVPNISFGQPVVASIRKKTALCLDVHLMITDPDRYIEEFARAGADILTVHAEACVHLHRTLQHIKSLGVKAGVALNPATGPEVLSYVLDQADLVLCMSVNPGFGGQKFIESTLAKVKTVDGMIKASGRDILLEVDGGVNPDNAAALLSAGVNVIVAGSAVVNSGDPAGVIAALRGKV